MKEEHRLSGFKALIESHKTNSYHLAEADGSFRFWRELSPEGRLHCMVRDAALYDVPFKHFAEAVRENVDNAAIEEAALRLAMHHGRELHELEGLFPDDGRTEPPPPLVKRVIDFLNAESLEHEKDAVLTCDKLARLFKEMRADEAAGKREDAHWYGKDGIE